ncbi:hypothetical protein T05_13138 [Trichinella murrelli]|uniref:Uncharacterized protein n=3 Tax=Trichinella murrelli TaxID=144512 RepID=A0A0V0T754_9BILA|nr:hypothetical protein T05_13138 [Trichinella murrelli]
MIVGERGAANEQWRFQCDDRRRRPLKTALYRRIEDKRRHHKDKDHEYYFNKFEWLSAFERFHVPCLVELSLGFICGKIFEISWAVDYAVFTFRSPAKSHWTQSDSCGKIAFKVDSLSMLIHRKVAHR